MNLINKTLCSLLLGFSVVKIFPQDQFYLSTNGNINNSFPKRNIYSVSNITPFNNKDSNELLDSLIVIYSDGNRIKITYNYNDDLLLIYYTFAHWVFGEWNLSDKRTNRYNSDGNLESVLWEWFNTSSGEWLNDAKDVYEYDSLENKSFHLHQQFNGIDFENDFKNEFYYDNANNLVLSVSQDWIDSLWVNRSRSIYKYTPENLNDTALFQIWTNDKWVDYQLNIYEYDQTLKPISNLVKRWQEDNWLNFAMETFEYDTYNNCVLEIWKIANNNSWENWFRIFYEYDDNNNLIHLFGEEWKNGQWVPEDVPLRVTNPDGILIGFIAKELFLYYSPPTDVEVQKNIVNEFILFQNYPNPFNPNTVISYNIPEHSFVTINIYNTLGENIKTLIQQEQAPGKYQLNFNGNNLPSGIYFYQLKTTKFQQTKKMLLLR